MFGLFGNTTDDSAWHQDVQTIIHEAGRLLDDLSACADSVDKDSIHGWREHAETMAQMSTYQHHFGDLGKSLDRVLALLAWTTGNAEQAANHFDNAIEFCRSAGYRPDLAWACSDYAEMLLDMGLLAGPSTRSTGSGQAASGTGLPDRGKAVELQDEAIAIAQELGMKPLLERVLARREMLTA